MFKDFTEKVKIALVLLVFTAITIAIISLIVSILTFQWTLIILGVFFCFYAVAHFLYKKGWKVE